MALEVAEIVRRFREGGGVGGVSLRASAGELVVLVGPSGCGKTTLLRLIAGLVPPDSGRIALDGTEITHLPPERRHLGFVFQNYALFAHLDVFSNIAFGLKARQWARDRIVAKVAEALALVGLGGAERRLPADLSGGEQQRVALARAIVTEPRVLLLDEPFSNLDPSLRRTLRAHLKSIQRTVGIPMVHVTHDREEALALATRVVVMDRGRVVQEGPPREVFESPGSAFVARFLGAANLLRAQGRPPHWAGHPLRVEPGSSPDGQSLFSLPPEALRLSANGPWTGRVVDVHYLGADTEVEIQVGEERVRARWPSQDRVLGLAPDATLHFDIDTARLVRLRDQDLPA